MDSLKTFLKKAYGAGSQMPNATTPPARVRFTSHGAPYVAVHGLHGPTDEPVLHSGVAHRVSVLIRALIRKSCTRIPFPLLFVSLLTWGHQAQPDPASQYVAGFGRDRVQWL